jgi:parallel beta-helix repeat protein
MLALPLLSALLVLPVALVPRVGAAAECGGGVACRCGDTLIGTYELREDLGPCEGDGIILRDAARLECRGHAIIGRAGTDRRRTGAGKTAAGRPAGGEDAADAIRAFGIVLDGTDGAVVRNCKVTGFDYGIELSEARNSRVIGCEAFHNGDFQTHAGYGVHLSKSRGNTVQDCLVRDSADEGIHIGGDSDGNTLVGNEARDNHRENFYVLSARGNRLLRNRARGAGTTHLYMKHVVDTLVEGNQFDARPVVVRGRSSGNVFANNTFGAGLKLEAYGEGQVEVPTGNVVRGGQLRGAAPCVEFIGARDNRVERPSIQGCRGFVARSIAPTVNDLVGIDVAGLRLDPVGGAVFRLFETVRVEVRDAAGRPVRAARIEVRDATGGSHVGPASGADGTAAPCAVPTRIVSAAGLVSLTPVVLTVSAEGYAPGQAVLRDPPPESVRLKLERAEGGGTPGRAKKPAKTISVP